MHFSALFIKEGFTRIVYGLFKKSVIADWIDYSAAWSWNNICGADIGTIILESLEV